MVATQSMLFFKFLLLGFFIGIIIGIFNLIKTFFNNKIVVIIIDFFTCLIFTICFIYLINKSNWGEIRLYLAVAQLLGVFIERISLGNLFAKFYSKMYNKSKVIKNNFLKSKVGKFLSK